MRLHATATDEVIPAAIAQTVARARSVAPLYRYLRERGITQAWLARRLEMRHGTLNNILLGKCQPPMPQDEFRERAADALGVPVSRIWPTQPQASTRRTRKAS